jgi:BMFP domain-containing protein YqiC
MQEDCGIVVKTLTLSERNTDMTTTSSRFFDEIAKVMNSAAGAAQGVRREIDGLVKSQVERVLNELEVVKREEFDAVKEMAGWARGNDRLPPQRPLERRVMERRHRPGPRSRIRLPGQRRRPPGNRVLLAPRNRV